MTPAVTWRRDTLWSGRHFCWRGEHLVAVVERYPGRRWRIEWAGGLRGRDYPTLRAAKAQVEGWA